MLTKPALEGRGLWCKMIFKTHNTERKSSKHVTEADEVRKINKEQKVTSEMEDKQFHNTTLPVTRHK